MLGGTGTKSCDALTRFSLVSRLFLLLENVDSHADRTTRRQHA